MGGAFDPFPLLGGYYQSLLLYHFFDSGLFDLLAEPVTAEFAARRLGWRSHELALCLEFLRLTTGLVTCDRRKRFHLTLSEAQMRGLRFQVLKFTGAYGPTAEKLDRSLRDAGSGSSLVNRRALADAFGAVKDVTRGSIVQMISEAGVSSLLDLGCGTGSLLVELARNDHQFRGIGVDGDRHMCRLARKSVRAHGVSERVRIIHEDGREVRAFPDASAIHAASLLNEFFADGTGEAAVRFLARLRRRYKQSDCWFVDYYGELGYGRGETGQQVTQAILHDLIQLLSGQGIPPPDLRSWLSIYRRAGVRLVEAHNFHEHGLNWFVHRVRL